MGPRSVLRIGVATAKSSLVLGETEDLCRPVVFLAKGFVYENSSTGGLDFATWILSLYGQDSVCFDSEGFFRDRRRSPQSLSVHLGVFR